MNWKLLGKSIELGGIILAGIALITGVVGDSMRGQMIILGVSVIVFVTGWLIETNDPSGN